MTRAGPNAPAERTAVPERYSLAADRGDHGVRLDLVLLRHLGGHLGLSRRRLQRAIEDGDVSVNGTVVTRAADRVAAGDRLDARLPASARRQPPRPQDLPLEVLFEDDHLLAVSKPPGIVSHPSYKHVDGTLFNALLWHLRDSPVQPRLLGRLDKDTSGALLVSKTRLAHAHVVAAMRNGRMRKEYLAAVWGVPRPASGEIALALARDRADVRRVAVTEREGKPSVTGYETLAVGALPEGGGRRPAAPTGRVALVRCELMTGRMHQIRVHLAARGWPIVGDAVYGAGGAGLSAEARSAKAGLSAEARSAKADGAGAVRRHMLHAWRISLAHPVTGDPLVIVAPIPDDMRAFIEAAKLTNDPGLTTND